MTMSWQEIEAVPGFSGAEKLAQFAIDPMLRAEVPPEQAIEPKAIASAFQLPMTLAMVTTVIGMSFVLGIFSSDWLRVPAAIFALPVIFFGSIIVMLRLFKSRLVDLIVASRGHFILRAKGMSAIADFLGLTYVPAPGGAPRGLSALSKFLGKPEALETLIETLNNHGGMDEALDIAKRSGLMLSNTIILASAEKRKEIADQAAEMQGLQDGFHGTRAGVAFDAFEWVEHIDEDDNVHHLMLVLPAPMRLQGVTELRSPKASWPNSGTTLAVTEVDLGARAFKDRFKLRSTDQTEARAVFNPAVMERVIALAGEDKVRAVAFSDGLVIDVAGKDRFALTHILTGEWSSASIQETFSDIAELVQLVEAAAHTFMVPKDRS